MGHCIGDRNKETLGRLMWDTTVFTDNIFALEYSG